MFPLAGNDFPRTAAELVAAIRGALSELATLPSAGEAVAVSGELPALQSVQVTLDGAVIREQKPSQKFESATARQPGFEVESITLSARPILYQQAKLNLQMSAAQLTFDFGRNATGGAMLVLTDAKSGTLEIDISEDDIEALALEAAKAGSKEYGIAVQDVHVVLVSDGSRSISVEIRLKAKKMLMSGVIIVRGRVDISDELVATVSNISCTGEGMVGSAAAAIVQKKIQPFDGTEVPLAKSFLGEIKMRDIRIAVDDSLRVSAAFGS